MSYNAARVYQDIADEINNLPPCTWDDENADGTRDMSAELHEAIEAAKRRHPSGRAVLEGIHSERVPVGADDAGAPLRSLIQAKWNRSG